MDQAKLIGLLDEAVSRIDDVGDALRELGAEGQGRDLLEQRVEDALALVQDINEYLRKENK